MQPQGHLQTLVRMLDYRQNPQAACDAPRWRWNAGILNAEGMGDEPLSHEGTLASADDAANDTLCAALDEVLDFTYRERELSVETNAAWQILHGVLAYQREFLIAVEGREVPAVDYLLNGGEMRGWTVEIVTRPGSGGRGLRAKRRRRPATPSGVVSCRSSSSSGLS